MIVDQFSFNGRATRAEFWAVHIVAGLLQAAVVMYLMLNSPALAKMVSKGTITLESLSIRNFVDAISLNRTTLLTIFLAPLVVTVAVAVRRLHDRDKTGWWVVAMLLPVFLALFASDFRPEMARPNEFDVFAICSAAWYFIDLGVLEGSPGANSYASARPSVPDAAAHLDEPPIETTQSMRNAEMAMERAIAERRASDAGVPTAFADRRRGMPDTRDAPVERRKGGDRRQGGSQGFGRRSA